MPQTFLYPYASTLYGAAWNIQQNMEGLGVASSNFVQRDPQGHIVNSYWSPAQATIPLLGMLALYSLALAVLFVVSGYVLGRKRGAMGAAGLLALPGCLNLVSLWPVLRYLPDRFDISGTGALGAPLGFLPLLALGVLLGWCLTIYWPTSSPWGTGSVTCTTTCGAPQVSLLPCFLWLMQAWANTRRNWRKVSPRHARPAVFWRVKRVLMRRGAKNISVPVQLRVAGLPTSSKPCLTTRPTM